ncbi:hypothetical protein D8771_21795 [Streptomyces albus]|uniref:Uncharacterized protein n=1 Tax=Streptomyces albus TaxID=1888 RepID=A0A8H1QNT3_9ACTN|nr:hypothetical protein D8771_21795 [Streptomyces albus]
MRPRRRARPARPPRSRPPRAGPGHPRGRAGCGARAGRPRHSPSTFAQNSGFWILLPDCGPARQGPCTAEAARPGPTPRRVFRRGPGGPAPLAAAL